MTGDHTTALADWKPGDTQTAQDRINQHGTGPAFAALTAGAVAVGAALTASRIKDAAKALATGTLAGHSPRTIGAAMRAALTDPDRAYAAALTETTRGVAAGAADGYQLNGVMLGRWQTEPDGNVCLVCNANAAAGPTPIGHPYPSGDAYPPAHPRCRCTVLPA